MSFPSSFVRPWKELLASHQTEQAQDWPNHYVGNPDALVTTSALKALHLGTGESVFTRALVLAVLSARRSVHLVTCYWAASPTRNALRDALVQLASAREPGSPPLRVTIGFSSRGLFQKLLHTFSRRGYVYAPSQWGKLGLPDEATLWRGGIDMTVKSLFFTPLSVVHPRYLVVDEQRALIPSCNVSWERWFEGCIELEGNAVQALLVFHEQVWGTGASAGAESRPENRAQASDGAVAGLTTATGTNDMSPTQSMQIHLPEATPTILLPSPHHRNPSFSFFPFLSQRHPPLTPLNAALLTLFANARRKITILTPNLTSGPVLDALLGALDRGVDVHIRTSKDRMLLEQLVTAGTTTRRCVRRLVDAYEELQAPRQPSDLEAQPVAPGKLEVLYFKPLAGSEEKHDEPVVSHFKMTFVDDEYLVLGSGNMDRASWWTSQELGILFFVPGFQGHAAWDRILERRTEVVFRSRHH